MRSRWFILIAIIWTTGVQAYAVRSEKGNIIGKDKKYPVSGIPRQLLENTDAVIRLDDRTFEVNDIRSGTYSRKYAVTILNQQGQKYGYFVNPYFGKSGLVQFTGTVFNAFGVEIDKIKKSDLEDRSNFDGFSIYSDSRYQSVTYTHHQYPYTIEYEFVERYDDMMFYPGWTPQWAGKLAVQKSDFTVLVPKEMELRYKEINLNESVDIATEAEKNSYSWSIEGLAAVEADQVGSNWKDLAPKVMVGPKKFEFEGYAGDMSRASLPVLSKENRAGPEWTRN